jgi:DNA-binding XRE family transcriptional regulator
MSDWWRLEADDGRFVREARDAWIYGPADARLAGLRVPGARDVTLGEAAPPDIERPRRRRDGFVFFRASVVAREPALSWVGGPSISGYLGVPVEEWEPREGEVVGMRAPELSDGFDCEIAVAEREVRAWRHARNRAARQRASLVVHARHQLGASGADVARWIGVTRNRVQQICEETSDPSVPRPASLDEAPAALRSANRAFARADQMLHRSEAMRRLRVATACDEHGFSLGAVARILDVSRSRAQQLRDAGREEAAAA